MSKILWVGCVISTLWRLRQPSLYLLWVSVKYVVVIIQASCALWLIWKQIWVLSFSAYRSVRAAPPEPLFLRPGLVLRPHSLPRPLRRRAHALALRQGKGFNPDVVIGSDARNVILSLTPNIQQHGPVDELPRLLSLLSIQLGMVAAWKLAMKL